MGYNGPPPPTLRAVTSPPPPPRSIQVAADPTRSQPEGPAPLLYPLGLAWASASWAQANSDLYYEGPPSSAAEAYDA